MAAGGRESFGARRRWVRGGLGVLALALIAGVTGALPGRSAQDGGGPWKRHTIDASSRGADGVRLADANGDGRLDIVTGWEEGGRVRLYLHPGAAQVRAPWPAVTVGEVASVEDAVLVDLDRDGSPDVVSAAEGRTRSLFVHWAPTDAARLLDPIAWSTTPIPGSRGRMQWMFTLPLQLDGKHGPDLVAAGKNEGAELGWWEAPRDARNLAEWHWRRLRAVGWIMSLVGEDMDGDGDTDLLCSDRKGPSAGVFWLENPGLTRVAGEWVEHPVAAGGREAMFLAVSDFDGDGRRDVVAAVKDQELLLCRRLDGSGLRWDVSSVSLPGNTGGAKAVQAGDLDGDGRAELVFTCVGATNGRHGVMGLRRAPEGSGWVPVIIGGPDGVKHDLVELQDLDSDGDLDVLTCEETRNLGVFWYENPSRK